MERVVGISTYSFWIKGSAKQPNRILVQLSLADDRSRRSGKRRTFSAEGCLSMSSSFSRRSNREVRLAGLIWSLSVCGCRLGLALLCGHFRSSALSVPLAVIGLCFVSSYWLSLLLQYCLYFCFIFKQTLTYQENNYVLKNERSVLHLSAIQ